MKKHGLTLMASAVLALTLSACDGSGPGEGAADLVFTGGTVWTASRLGTVESVAVRDGRIMAAGDADDVAPLIGPETQVVELDGRMLSPGIIDTHTHFLSGGFQLSSVDLRDAATPEEFARRIGEFASTVPAGQWITGGDWDHEMWGGELPKRDWIDALTPNNPVFVSRLDGHMALANTLAIRAGGLDEGAGPTPVPSGGTIVRNPATREAEGVFKDTAMGLILGVMPASTEEELDRALDAAAAHALSMGVTQVHDMATFESLETYRRAQAAGRLPLRVYSVVPIAEWERLRDYVAAEGRGDDRLWWGGLKGLIDGSLGSTTAWFYEPYVDEPGTSGLMTSDTASIRSWIADADEAGLHVIVHAIGDRANDWLLDVYESVALSNGERDRRFRIEHAQHLTPTAINRFAELGVIASMQPYHAVDDGRWAEKRIGPERIKTTYAFRSLGETGAVVSFGSDWTVAPIDPVLGIDAAVNRRTTDGANPGGWVPGERITVGQALLAYTRSAAFAGYKDDRLGSIEVGKLADMVVFSRDLFASSPEEIIGTVVDMTLVGGEIVYRREGTQ